MTGHTPDEESDTGACSGRLGDVNGVRTDAVLAGRYRLRRRLGAGGMSVVWLAYDRVLERPVAIKVLSGTGHTDRIRTEARAVARLVHPHVVNVFDYAETTTPDGTVLPFVVMELVDGESLAERLRTGPLPWPTAVRLAGEVADALAAAHERGIVHRDVTARNVLLTDTGAKVVDFGISVAAGTPDSEPGENTIVGTPAYLSPERLAGLPVEPAADVYSLGVLLHVLLTGDSPFGGETTGDVALSHWYGPPAPLPAIPGLPPEVDRLRRRCLAKRAKDRPAAAELATALAALATASPSDTAFPSDTASSDVPPSPEVAAPGDRPSPEPAALSELPPPTRVEGSVPHPVGATTARPEDAAGAVPRAVEDVAAPSRPVVDGSAPPARSVDHTAPGTDGAVPAGAAAQRVPADATVPGGHVEVTRELPVVPASHRPARRGRRRTLAVLGAVTVLAAAGGSGAAVLLRSEPDPAPTTATPVTDRLVPSRGTERPSRPSRSATRSAAPSPSRTPVAEGCRVRVTIGSTWDTGYSATIRFTPSRTGWTLGFRLPPGQKVASLWNGRYTTRGRTVTVQNASWNARGDAEVGLTVSGRTGAGGPGAFTLDGTACPA